MAREVVLVTGAGSGIGLAVARRLLADGEPVLAAGRRRASLERLEEERGGVAGDLELVAADLSTPVGVESIAEHCVSLGLRLRATVHSVGAPNPVGPLWAADAEALQRSVATLVTSALLVTRLALSPQLAVSDTKLLLVSSGAGRKRTPWRAVYGAGKAAVDHLVASVAEELRLQGRSAAIAGLYPGMVDTPLQASLRAEAARLGLAELDGFVEAHAAGRLLDPAAVGDAIVERTRRRPEELNGRIFALRGGGWEPVQCLLS